MRQLGTWFNGGLGSAGGMVGLDDVRGLFQLKAFCGPLIPAVGEWLCNAGEQNPSLHQQGQGTSAGPTPNPCQDWWWGRHRNPGAAHPGSELACQGLEEKGRAPGRTTSHRDALPVGPSKAWPCPWGLYLRLLIDLLADALSQHDEHGHGRLHVALLGVEEQRVPHDGVEEVGGQAVLVEGVGDGDQREGLHGGQRHRLGLVAADVRGVGLVLQVVQGRWVVHDFVAQREGFLGKAVFLLFSCQEKSRNEQEKTQLGQTAPPTVRSPCGFSWSIMYRSSSSASTSPSR